MSLATRCTSCGTVFRVVQDQLKVSEGWVRCGRCNEVFNALEGLFDLERDTPPEWSPALAGGPAASASGASAEAAWNVEGFVPETDPQLVDKLDTRLFGSRRPDPNSTPAKHVRARDRHEFSDAQFNPEWVADDQVLTHDGGAAHDAAERLSPDQVVAPEFLRRAQRQARWRSPAARATLSVASLVLMAALTWQGVHHFRDLVAARWPGLQPALLAWCGVADCRIGTPRRIEDISVESTALTRAAAPDSFRLSVTLRSKSTLALAMPSIELSLTDTAGQLLARRALMPSDFRVAPTTLLQPGGESVLQLALSAGGQRVSGYTVEIFYP
jgi:predicted Zn finger-like uncharacterized protein